MCLCLRGCWVWWLLDLPVLHCLAVWLVGWVGGFFWFVGACEVDGLLWLLFLLHDVWSGLFWVLALFCVMLCCVGVCGGLVSVCCVCVGGCMCCLYVAFCFVRCLFVLFWVCLDRCV